jgi:ribonuclease BN (tRNA processing enzyme)
VKKLVLVHLSARYSVAPEELLTEARTVFAETVVARDGMTVEVPYSD